VKIFNPVIHHEGCGAGSKVTTFLWIDQPGSCACNRLALGVGPFKGSSAPCLDIDSQVPLVPSLKRWFGFEEDATNARDSLHGTSMSNALIAQISGTTYELCSLHKA
jgi:hypothetical protein